MLMKIMSSDENNNNNNHHLQTIISVIKINNICGHELEIFRIASTRTEEK